MRYLAFTTLLAVVNIPIASAVVRGFALGTWKDGSSGQCRLGSDWDKAFKDLKALPQKIVTIHLTTSTGGCAVLNDAVPAAIKAGAQIFQGLYATGSDDTFDAELNALTSAIVTHGSSWLIGIEVGSQDLANVAAGNPGADAATIVKRINKVRTVMADYVHNVPIGHTEPAATWLKTAAAHGGIIDASDYVGLSEFPFFDGLTVNAAATAVSDRLSQVQAISGSKVVWVMQTGWPVSGATIKNAVPSVANAQYYWQNVACTLWNVRGTNTFWFTYYDVGASTSFGVYSKSGAAIYDLKLCPAAS
ncbi:hypothetical protein LTR97_000840 [Elasticomyces elasticus]|uniref:glucan endo-1,3-beta-D-glucosidase n=1 Tax=Elasticomyces elasticus TaxID=574655 RepID=A0AAN7WKR7_9PEZI|nr:hypothetical protein LTR97_000840 [Elasticomyces elasticus]